MSQKKPFGYYKNIISVRQRDDRKEYMRQWTLINKKEKKIYDKKNKDQINAMRRKRRQTETGKKLLAAEQKRYREKHRAKINQKYLNRRKTDSNFKLLTILRTRIVDVLRGHSKSDTTINILGCTIEELWIHLESKFTEGMTRENHGKWHVDHIMPCASFDLTDPEQQKKCFHYTNLQPLWALDNIKKGKSVQIMATMWQE